MRGCLLALFALAVAACEDGPAQPYGPAAVSNGSPGSYVDPATQGFPNPHGGHPPAPLCDDKTKEKVWATMDEQPIVPGRGAGGLDMAGKDWQGITIEDAEQILCQANDLGDFWHDGSTVACWGDGDELCAHAELPSRRITSLLLIGPGYAGAIEATGCSGSASQGHTYRVPMYVQMQRDAVPWTIDWSAPKSPDDWRNEITSAIMCTFEPAFAHDADCNASGGCVEGSFGDVAYLYLRALGLALWVPNQNAPQPQPSILDRIDLTLSRVMAYSFDAVDLKIDATGPTASSGAPLGVATQPCVARMGVDFADFASTCVQVTGDPTADKNELAKLLGGITHTDERFHFDVPGPVLDFTDDHLASDAIVTDQDRPAAGDTSSLFTIDQLALGPITQDRAGNDPARPRDAHGGGLVALQYARRAQAALVAAMRAQDSSTPARSIGEAACFAAQAYAHGGAGAGKGCTGLEEIVTSAPAPLAVGTPDASIATAALGAGVFAPDAPQALRVLRQGLKPGRQSVAFCDDHADLGACDPQWIGAPFATSFERVRAVLGGGSASNLPLDARDARFFFREWVKAAVQFLKAEGAAAATGKDESLVTLGDLAAQPIDDASFFFDSIADGAFETGEYVERSFADDSTPPLDVVIEADVANGIQMAWQFSRHLMRGERAVATAMIDGRDGKDHGPGSQDTMRLSNVFGSALLRTAWKDHTKDAHGGPMYTPFYCATHDEPVPCNGEIAPLDEHGDVVVDEAGRPILAAYPGAFAGFATAFTIGGGGASQSVPIAVIFAHTGPNGDGTYPGIQQAMIEVPLREDPYDLSSASRGAVEALVPWQPKLPGVGFPVAVSGTRDRFISTYRLVLDGTQLFASLDYDWALDSKGNPTPQLMLLAVQSSDFLGDVFLCRDATTKEVLGARMYAPTQAIVEWIANHPGAANACQMIVRYSSYGNDVDAVTSLANGVRVRSTQGGGFARIVGATLFDPTLPGQ